MKKIAMVIFLMVLSLCANAKAYYCVQGEEGGQCVAYVRSEFGGDLSKMPGLCQYDPDCGARFAWDNWDLGFGKGSTPQSDSIMVLDGWSTQTVGHVAVVIAVALNDDGSYDLTVNESNFCTDNCELMSCGVTYTFYPSTSEVIRENGASRYPVLGFIYSYSFVANLFVDDNYPNPINPNCANRTGTADDPFCAIQEGIDVAEAGNIVLVADGTYPENINFNGKAITVRSENGPEATIIDGSQNGSVVTFESGEDENSVLDGFTITNGSGTVVSGVYTYGGGIYCYYSSPSINNCTINGNSAIGGNYSTSLGAGGGIYCVSSSPVITNCAISSNSAMGKYARGGGIACHYYSSPTMTNCTINGNSATGGDYAMSSAMGGGIYCSYSSPMITNCTISDNSSIGGNYSKSWGGGIICYSYSSPTITNCIISGNSATGGDGGQNWGGGIFCYKSSPMVANCTISANSAIGMYAYGGGIYSYNNASPIVVNSILWGDTAGGNGNEIYLSGGYIGISFSNIEGGWTGTGNINADPLFIGSDDYHLQPDSPCIDIGTDDTAAYPNLPFDDIDGDSRPQGAGYDMGADEVAETIETTETIHTPIGENVTVSPLNTTITFDSVTTAGDTTVTVSPSSTFLPQGFQLLDNSYDITTTAIYSGPVDVCFNYSDSGLTQDQEDALMLIHYTGVSCEDITTSLDTENNKICGQATSLSPFFIAYPTVANYNVDEDGYGIDQDCDDNNPDINPGADEVHFNGLDDDCNPATPDITTERQYFADEIRVVADLVSSLECEQFRQGKCKYRRKLVKKLNKIADKLLLAPKHKLKKNLKKAARKLKKVAKRFNGCVNQEEPDNNDWIVDCQAQEEIYDAVMTVISNLQTAIEQL